MISLPVNDLPEYILENPKLLQTWVWVLRQASSGKSKTVPVGKGTTKVSTGQGELITRTTEAAGQLNMSPSTLYRHMKHLEDAGLVELNPCSHYTHVTVARWDQYRDTSYTSPPYEEVKKHWNEFADDRAVPRVRKMSDVRKALVQLRWQEWQQIEGYDGALDYFQKTLDRASESPFLLGDNDRGWAMDFDFLFQNETNHLKIWEGVYDGPAPMETEAGDSDDQSKSSGQVPYQKIKKIWNKFADHAGNVPRVNHLSASRRRKVQSRWGEWKEIKQVDGPMEYYRKTLYKALKSDFLTGDNDRGWVFNFDFLFDNDNNHLKVWEGVYDDHQKQQPQTTAYPEHLRQ